MLLNKILGLSPSNLEPWWVMLDRFMSPKESTARLERAALELFLKPNQRQKDASWLLGLSVKKGGPVWDPSCPENTWVCLLKLQFGGTPFSDIPIWHRGTIRCVFHAATTEEHQDVVAAFFLAFLLLLSCQCCYIVDSVTFSALSLVAAVAVAAPAEVRRFQSNKPYAAGLQRSNQSTASQMDVSEIEGWTMGIEWGLMQIRCDAIYDQPQIIWVGCPTPNLWQFPTDDDDQLVVVLACLGVAPTFQTKPNVKRAWLKLLKGMSHRGIECIAGVPEPLTPRPSKWWSCRRKPAWLRKLLGAMLLQGGSWKHFACFDSSKRLE